MSDERKSLAVDLSLRHHRLQIGFPLSASLVFQAEPTLCANEPELFSFEAAGREPQCPAVFRHCSYNVSVSLSARLTASQDFDG